MSATLVDDDHASSGLVTFYLLNISGSPTTVTLNCSSSNGYMVMAEDVKGIAASAALDGHAINVQASNSGSTDAITSGPITTTIDSDFIFGVTNSSPNGGDTITPGTGYIGWQAGAASDLAIGPYDGSTYQYTWEDESQVQTFHGSVAVTFTPQFTSYQFTTAIMAFKPL